MQTSALVALRTFVMLFSLVAIPLAAVIGTGSWPQLMDRLMQLKSQLIAASLSPGNASHAHVGATSATALPTSNLQPPIMQPPVMAATPSQPAVPAANAPTAPPTTIALPAAPVLPQRLPAQEPLPVASLPPLPDAEPVADRPETRPPQDSVPQASAAVPDTDPLVRIPQQLQQLGAAYYRLETAGPHGQSYRFLCRVESAVNPNYGRYFEAIHPEASRAMQQVLDQVQKWLGLQQGTVSVNPSAAGAR